MKLSKLREETAKRALYRIDEEPPFAVYVFGEVTTKINWKEAHCFMKTLSDKSATIENESITFNSKAKAGSLKSTSDAER